MVNECGLNDKMLMWLVCCSMNVPVAMWWEGEGEGEMAVE